MSHSKEQDEGFVLFYSKISHFFAKCIHAVCVANCHTEISIAWIKHYHEKKLREESMP